MEKVKKITDREIIRATYKHGGFIKLMQQLVDDEEPHYQIEHWDSEIDVTRFKTKVETCGSLEKIRKAWRRTINIDYMAMRRVEILYPENQKVIDVYQNIYYTNKEFYIKLKYLLYSEGGREVLNDKTLHYQNAA